MKNISTVATKRNEIFKDHKRTIGLDLGGRYYCILKEAGEEHRFSRVPYIRGAGATTR